MPTKDDVPKRIKIDDIEDKIFKLRAEVNCRIEHGAESNGHLEYVQSKLDEIYKLLTSRKRHK